MIFISKPLIIKIELLSDCLFFLCDLFRFISSGECNGMGGVGKRYMLLY